MLSTLVGDFCFEEHLELEEPESNLVIVAQDNKCVGVAELSVSLNTDHPEGEDIPVEVKRSAYEEVASVDCVVSVDISGVEANVS